MFGNQSDPSLVYSFGARRPTEGLALVLDQMRGAHRYRNLLVEIERDRRAKVDAALAEMSPELVEAEGDIETLAARLDLARQEVKDASREARTRKRAAPAGKAALDAIKAELRAARARRKALRAALFRSVPWIDRQRDIDAEDLAARKAARRDSGLFSSTYLHVEQSMAGCRRGARGGSQGQRDAHEIATRGWRTTDPDTAVRERSS